MEAVETHSPSGAPKQKHTQAQTTPNTPQKHNSTSTRRHTLTFTSSKYVQKTQKTSQDVPNSGRSRKKEKESKLPSSNKTDLNKRDSTSHKESLGELTPSTSGSHNNATETRQAEPYTKASEKTQTKQETQANSQPQAESTTLATVGAKTQAETHAQKTEAMRRQAGKTQANSRARAPRGRGREELSAENIACKVYVTGYPNFTQPRDLLLIFSVYGTVQVDKINRKFAVLTFATAEEATEAVRDTQKVNMYGEFLIVKPFNIKVSELLSPKARFTKSKQKSVIIDPDQIDLSGDFEQQLESILSAVRLTLQEVSALDILYSDVERVLQPVWPGCQAIPFGSITTGLGIKTSDADCFVKLPPFCHRFGGAVVLKARKILQRYPQLFTEIFSIPRANTPIVKFFHIPTDMNCDLTFKTILGAQNSKLIGFLLASDPRLIPMSVLVKYWAKVHGFSGTGKLTNYALTLLIIFYLQQPFVAILPSILWLQRDPAKDHIVDCWNVGFMDRPEVFPKTSNTWPISKLLGGFFEFYATFNFKDLVVCPFLGYAVRKDLFNDFSMLPKEYARYVENVLNGAVMPIRVDTPICVQDPLEQSHNVASAIGFHLAIEFREYFKFAYAAYKDDLPQNCMGFLKEVLLNKPDIEALKLPLEYRAKVSSDIITRIMVEDWKGLFRDIVKKIFEEGLMLSLDKIEEEVKQPPGKEIERYSCVVNRPVWRRKPFTKLYQKVEMDFFEKQVQITQDVLKIDATPVNIEFILSMTFTDEPKGLLFGAKYIDGDVDCYFEFGKFFSYLMHGWVTNLLLIHLYPENPKNNRHRSRNMYNPRNKAGVSNNSVNKNVKDTNSESVNVTRDN